MLFFNYFLLAKRDLLISLGKFEKYINKVINVQQTKELSVLPNVSWRVEPSLLVPFSHCKSQLGVDLSLAFQCDRDTSGQGSTLKPSTDRVKGSLVCCRTINKIFEISGRSKGANI